MHNITLISTRHKEIGECNSSELYRIIETINPEVIFEELPPSYFDKFYVHKTNENLESKAISMYLKEHRVVQIPVDLENSTSESFFKDYEYMIKRIEGLADANGFHFRKFADSHRENAAVNGFKYLNSNYCININDGIYKSIEDGLLKINDDKLFQILNLWKDVNSRREDEMLRNIFNYSKEHSYNKAMFMIGSAHRKEIIRKIAEFESKGEIKLDWLFYQ